MTGQALIEIYLAACVGYLVPRFRKGPEKLPKMVLETPPSRPIARILSSSRV